VFATEPTCSDNATESGAYTLLGFAPTPSNGNSVVRNDGATEWYKAAFYDPTTN
jgi:hypothetical protein